MKILQILLILTVFYSSASVSEQGDSWSIYGHPGNDLKVFSQYPVTADGFDNVKFGMNLEEVFYSSPLPLVLSYSPLGGCLFLNAIATEEQEDGSYVIDHGLSLEFNLSGPAFAIINVENRKTPVLLNNKNKNFSVRVGDSVSALYNRVSKSKWTKMFENGVDISEGYSLKTELSNRTFFFALSNTSIIKSISVGNILKEEGGQVGGYCH